MLVPFKLRKSGRTKKAARWMKLEQDRGAAAGEVNLSNFELLLKHLRGNQLEVASLPWKAVRSGTNLLL